MSNKLDNSIYPVLNIEISKECMKGEEKKEELGKEVILIYKNDKDSNKIRLIGDNFKER